MTTVVLIMIIRIYSGITVVQQEFWTYEKCEAARIHINETIRRGSDYIQIGSQGCYKK